MIGVTSVRRPRPVLIVQVETAGRYFLCQQGEKAL
ncbi:hypothetical protein H4W31_001151 [Plantactinospora soyae]|uniref:Uncharacterized protein n=1 Tax=Plantactinospora soyae TaxID=1544732 RepID=A0A927M4W0_9ACTN|nr:hypothetical protein [Plantactinospora soyae]